MRQEHTDVRTSPIDQVETTGTAAPAIFATRQPPAPQYFDEVERAKYLGEAAHPAVPPTFRAGRTNACWKLAAASAPHYECWRARHTELGDAVPFPRNPLKMARSAPQVYGLSCSIRSPTAAATFLQRPCRPKPYDWSIRSA